VESGDLRALCDKELVQSDQDQEKETALFCQDGDNPSGFVMLLDTQNGEEKEIWRKNLISDQNVGNLRVSDSDSDGIDELLYEEFGTTACCGTLFQYLYSPKYGKEFYVIRDSGTNTETLQPFCSISYSENLQQPRYQAFKEFLDQEISCSAY
jgi:hypothetical protein